MFDKLLKAKDMGEEAPMELMDKESPRIKAKMDMVKELRNMAMKMMKEDAEGGEAPEGELSVSVLKAEPMEAEGGLDLELDSEMGNEMSLEDESPEALKARIKELEAKLATR